MIRAVTLYLISVVDLPISRVLHLPAPTITDNIQIGIGRPPQNSSRLLNAQPFPDLELQDLSIN